jgi:hypothetical protein
VSNVIQLVPPSDSDDGFSSIYDAMAEQLDALRTVQATMELHHTDLGEQLDAALGVLIRATRRIDELHTALEEWHLRRRRPREV